MPNLPQFQAGSTAQSAHTALKKSIEILDKAHHCTVLWFGEIMHRKLHRELGFSTMRAYAMEELGFSSTRTGDFIRLAEKLRDLPVMQEELAAGRLGYSKALEVIPVADAGNEKDWVKLAQENPRTKVREEVRRARRLAVGEKKDNPAQTEMMPRPVPTAPPASVPVPVGFTLTPVQYARYNELMAKVDHRGSKAELLLAMAEALVADDEPKVARRRAIEAPPVQIHVHKCPKCAKVAVQTPMGEVELSQAEAEGVGCDAEVHVAGEANRSTIPPRVRREVLTRDRHQCRRKGCQNTRYVHLHHVTPRAKGGTNEAENLVTLCAACHDLWHERGGKLEAMLKAVPADSR